VTREKDGPQTGISKVPLSSGQSLGSGDEFFDALEWEVPPLRGGDMVRWGVLVPKELRQRSVAAGFGAVDVAAIGTIEVGTFNGIDQAGGSAELLASRHHEDG